jgi:hypothetical protein
MTAIRIGLDIAKNVFQAHGVDDNGTVVIRQRLRRPDILRFFASLPPCLIGIEACSASHHWARELIQLGHDVRLMPARYVKPYVQRGKSDALDAEAICEAVSRPTMRFATIKTSEQQSVLTLHRSREILVKQETMLANLIRGCLGEFGIVAPLGIRRVPELIAVIKDDADPASCRKHGSACERWPISCAICRNGSSRSNRRSEPGTAAMMPAGVWPPFLGLAVLPPRRLSPRWPMRPSSNRRAISLPFSV